MEKLVLKGKIDWSQSAGTFRHLVNQKKEIFCKYCGVYLFPGSLNIRVVNPSDLQEKLDRGEITPTFTIPKNELKTHLGDGQAWKCRLHCKKFSKPIYCWIFRRKKSGVPPKIIEILAEEELVNPYGLKNGDSVTIEVI